MPKPARRIPNRNVFLNCPFDAEYRPILEALVFAVHDCGYIARSALEFSDSSQVRIDKIYRLVAECRLGIHDLSRTKLDAGSALPRFNMPLELGIFLGAKRFGGPAFKQKRCLVLVGQQYLHQQYCSDISGQDVSAHEHKPQKAIAAVRSWLRTQKARNLPSAAHIASRFGRYRAALPAICDEFDLDPEDLEFADLSTVIAEWIRITEGTQSWRLTPVR